MKKRPNSELLQKKWKNDSSERDFFSKHFGLIHLAGLRVLKHFFFEKKITSFHLSLSLSLFILSLLLSCFFSLLVFSLLFSSLLSSLIFSCLVFHLLSSLCILNSSFIFCPVSSSSCGLFFHLFTCLASSLVFSRLSSHMSLHMSCFFSCLFSSLSLSLSVSLCVSLSVLCGVCVSPCVRSKTPPCVPAPRPHVITHAGVVPVHTGTFRTYTRGRFECTHGGGRGEGRAGHRQFCLPKFAHVRLSLDPRGSAKKPLVLTHSRSENRSRTTRYTHQRILTNPPTHPTPLSSPPFLSLLLAHANAHVHARVFVYVCVYA